MPTVLLAERFWHLVAFNSFARKQKYDAVLFPSGAKLLPLKFEVPSVVVVQDILSDVYKNSDDIAITGLLKMQLRKAQRIIASSRFVRDDLMNLHIPESRITVVHNGIDTSLFYPHPTVNNEAVLIHPFSIRRPYIIYASRVAYPSKCHVELVKAFSIFKKKNGRAASSRSGWRRRGKRRDRSPRDHQVPGVVRYPFNGVFPPTRICPNCTPPPMPVFFRRPSKEWGFPFSRRWPCGIPVACARAGALPEMAGDNVLYFDQNSPEEIASAIERLVRTPTGENEALRNDLVNRSLEWVKGFDWKKSAQETIACMGAL